MFVLQGPFGVALRYQPTALDMAMLPHERTYGPLGGKPGLCAKLYPNGETVVYRPREATMKPVLSGQVNRCEPWPVAVLRLAISCRKAWEVMGSPLGLSILPIFDRLEKPVRARDTELSKTRGTKGLGGITAYGRRTVRNACYLIEQNAGRARCIFATVTLPSLPIEEMSTLHESWGKVVELYRLNMKRMLQDKGLSGEMVSVTEVQEKRYENTGLPVLHLHSVFVGVDRVGKYAISIEQHDAAWVQAVGAVVRVNADDFTTACNLQRVRKSAAAYLGKYMSKGAKVVAKIANTKFARWLPRHWWNCSRSLSRAIKQQTRRIDDMAEFLADCINTIGCEIWEWHRTVTIQTELGYEYPIATYGKLKPDIAQGIHAYYSQANV